MKSSHPPAHRRPPPMSLPMGLRSHSNHSIPILNGPPTRRCPGPPPPRTASAASVTSWNASNSPFRNRVNSSSSRTSSLTSVVNMYYRMPPVLKATQFGSAGPPPRYYDYTEEFENEQPLSQTPGEPAAPVPIRESSTKRSLLQREESAGRLATAFEVQADQNVLDGQSQEEDSRTDTEPHLLSDIDIEGDGSHDNQESSKMSYGLLPATTNDRMQVSPRTTMGPRKLTRGNDIDLLPSQIGRASVDTFRPSLDIESKATPLFSYPTFRHSTSNQTNTPSPARQVEIHVKTPTIKSEQGVILRDDDVSEYASQQIMNTADKLVLSPTNWRSVSESTHDILEDSSKLSLRRRKLIAIEPGQPEILSDRTKPRLPRTSHGLHDKHRIKHLRLPEQALKPPVPPKINDRVPVMLSKPQKNHGGLRLSLSEGTGFGKYCADNKTDSRCYKNHRALEISTTDTPQYDETPLQLTPSCSTTPLISPKPMSPVRELKVKNSIPQLMKALPSVPRQPGSVSPSPPITPDDKDEFTEILKPYTSLNDLVPGPKVRVTASLLSRPLPEIQKKLPRIRIKSKGPDAELRASKRDSRPWNSDSNYPWCNHEPDMELANMQTKYYKRTSIRNRLRIRGSRTVCGGSPAGTVRRYPEAHQPEILDRRLRKEPRDLFSVPNSLGSAFRKVSRKFSHGSDASSKHCALSLSQCRTSSTLHVKPPRNSHLLLLFKDGNDNIRVQDRIPGDSPTPKNLRGFKKRFPNLKWLLARKSQLKPKYGTMEDSAFLHVRRQAGLESTFGTDNVYIENDNYTLSDCPAMDKPQRPRFRRRMRAKVSRWIWGAKPTVMYS